MLNSDKLDSFFESNQPLEFEKFEAGKREVDWRRIFKIFLPCLAACLLGLMVIMPNIKKSVTIYPASHFVTSEEKLTLAIKNIREELNSRLEEFKGENKLLEYQRLMERTNYDLEMLSETGFCHGVESYSRHVALKEPGATPNYPS